MKLCDQCGMNPTKSNKSKRCESCDVAFKRERAALAMYRHRERVRKGKARHNLTYKGQPTVWAKQNLPVERLAAEIRSEKSVEQIVREMVLAELERFTSPVKKAG